MTSKKYLPTLLLLLSGLTSLYGQAPQAAAALPNVNGLSDVMTTIFLFVASLLFFIVIVVVVRTNAMLTKNLIRLESAKHGIMIPDESTEFRPVEEDFFSKLRKKYWENPLPREREGEITLEHSYDGIRELDNHLPPWWVNMFILTVIWSVGYMWYYHWGGNGQNQLEEYTTEVATAKKALSTSLAGKANAVDESNVTVLTDASSLSDGELTFKTLCAACHGAKGEGIVGPNFTDEYWIHGGGIKNIFKTIKYGVPEKGMIAWAAQLKPVDMQKVACYILTLKGTKPPNPKAPQGTVWTEESVTQDSTKTK